MFGENRVTTPHAFDDQAGDSLRVTSIFPTLQGEGPFAGRPCVFVRLTGCNLQCSFCDTYFDKGDDLTFDCIHTQIKIAVATMRTQPFVAGSVLVVITGGEPFLQKQLPAFLYFLHALGYSTQIETNGNFWLDVPASTHIVCSPKINEKTGLYIRLHERIYAKADTMKFVISATMPGYRDVPDWAITWANERRGSLRTRRIYVSPMNCYASLPIKRADDGTLEGRSTDERISFWTPNLLDLESNQRNHEHAARIAIRRNVLLTLQIHLYASLP